MGNFLRIVYDKEHIGYVAVYLAAPSVDVPSIEPDSSLLALHASIGSSGSAHLFSYWRDENSFKLGAPLLQQKLNLNDPLVQGPWGQPRMRTRHWWQFGSLKELLLAGSAIIGAWTVLESTAERGWDRVAAAPQAALHLSAPDKDFLAGSQAVVVLDWQNSSSAPITVTGSKFFLTSSTGLQLVLNPEKGKIPNLDGSASAHLNLLAKFNQPMGKQSSPTSFVSSGWIQGKAGLLAAQPRFEPTSPPTLVVWPRLSCPPNPILKREIAHGRVAEFEGVIYSGDPHFNIKASITLFDTGLNMEVQSAGSAVPVHAITDTGSTAILDLGDTKKFSSHPLRILIKSARDSVTDWREIAHKILIECE